MTAGRDRWHQIEELYQASMDLPEGERGVFLRESCGGDEQLRLEVESLLANSGEESPVITAIVDNATAELLEEEEP